MTHRQYLKPSRIGTVFAAFVGFAVAVIVAINVVIFSGIDDGYEASLPEVFRQNALVGVLVVLILAVGPVVGVVIARRR